MNTVLLAVQIQHIPRVPFRSITIDRLMRLCEQVVRLPKQLHGMHGNARAFPVHNIITDYDAFSLRIITGIFKTIDWCYQTFTDAR